MKQKSIIRFTSLLLTFGLFQASFGNLTVNAGDLKGTGSKDGYDWELWNLSDEGTVDMQIGSNGTFSCLWEDTDCSCFNSGKILNSKHYWSDYGETFLEYDITCKADGNSYVCVYGWTEDPTVEYYIVEGWNSWRPPGMQNSLGTVSSDGKQYDIYTTSRILQPSIHGIESFDQYWSVNKTNPIINNHESSIHGAITVSNHFAEWEKCGMNMGKLYDIFLHIEGYKSNGKAIVNKNYLYSTKTVEPDPEDKDKEKPKTESTLDILDITGTSSDLSDDFEKQTSAWYDRESDIGIYKYDEGYALAATGRTDYWNGLQGDLADSGTYKFEADLFANEDTEFTIGVQYDENDSTIYNNTEYVSGSAGKWTPVSTEIAVPDGVKNARIFVMAGKDGDSNFCDFAMDNVKMELIDSDTDTNTDSVVFGDINLDGKVELTDLTLLSLYLMGDIKLDSDALKNADVQYDCEVDIRDLATLKRYIVKDKAVVLGNITNIPVDNDKIVKIQNKVVNGVLTSTCDTSWIPEGSKVTAISFDDGLFKDSTNPVRIHNALKKNGFHATFFYWGEHISGCEQEIIDAYNSGFEVANHTWTHPYLTQQEDHGVSEVENTKKALNQILGTDNDYSVRAPYLSVDEDVLSACNVPFPNCGIDTEDWNNASKDSIVNTLKSSMSSSELENKVVLCHESYSSTAGAMEEFFPYMKKNGWVNTSVIEMFKYNNKEMKCGTLYDGC